MRRGAARLARSTSSAAVRRLPSLRLVVHGAPEVDVYAARGTREGQRIIFGNPERQLREERDDGERRDERDVEGHELAQHGAHRDLGDVGDEEEREAHRRA